MNAQFPFCRAIAIAALIMISAGSASGALSAPGDPPFPIQLPVSVNGYHLGGEEQVSEPLTSSDPNRFLPAIAYDYTHNLYLVVWHQINEFGYRDVWGRLVNTAGKPVAPQFIISGGTYNNVQPAVAFSGTSNEYLVVYMSDVNGNGQKYDIRGQRLSFNGAFMGDELTIQTFANRSFWSPEIAWNAVWDEFVVVWGALAQDTQTATDIGYKILSPTGSVIWASIITSTGYPTNPDIAYDPVHCTYLVVWNYLNASGHNVVAGDLRDGEANHVRSISIFGSTTNDALYPRVTMSMGLFYLVVFEYEYSVTDHDIKGAWVTQDALSAIPIDLDLSGANDTSPQVTGSSSIFEFMVAYQRADPSGSKIRMLPVSNLLPLTGIDICNYASTNCADPVVEYGGRSYLNAYIIELPSYPLVEAPLPPSPIKHVFDCVFNSAAIFLPAIMK